MNSSFLAPNSEKSASEPARGRASYSDGDEVEELLLDIVSRAGDLRLGSLELSQQLTSFPLRYHLSPVRANLLRPLADLLRGRVLEVGAGCGALTRFLGENGAQVSALEGSERRARIARSRCRDLGNVSVVATPLQDFQTRERFDVVALIGVLEYSRQFYSGESGPQEMLRRCRELLAPGGYLVLAIENQLGLKYLAGAPEDHLGLPYFGVHDQYGPGTQVTFGRRELQKLLAENGFPHQEFLYPFPDYKFPHAVFPAATLQAPQAHSERLLQRLGAPDQFAHYQRSFSEEIAWPVFLRNGLAEDLANSFLVVASGHEAPSTPRPLTVYSMDRRRALSKATIFGERQVRRAYLYDDRPEPHALYRHQLTEEPLYSGPLLGQQFQVVLNRPSWNEYELAQCAHDWIAYLRTHRVDNSGAAGEWLPGDFVNCIPFQLICQADGTFCRIDQEWVCSQPVPLGFVVFRGVLDVLLRAHNAATPGAVSSTLMIETARQTLRYAGLAADDGPVADWLEREAQLQEFAAGKGELVRHTYPHLTFPHDSPSAKTGAPAIQFEPDDTASCEAAMELPDNSPVNSRWTIWIARLWNSVVALLSGTSNN